MSAIPFAIRRPWLLIRDLMVDRDRPDLDRLRRVQSPERFVWAVLPHAARTFSACIAMLPTPSAKAAAVGYLYCRILDTYEDLAATADQGRHCLRAFARRFGRAEKAQTQLDEAPQLSNARTVDQRDQAHLLLIERCHLIDQVYLDLPDTSREAIVELVRDMASGMIWAKRVFENQGGVLQNDQQLRHYCDGVLGNPVAFTMRLLSGQKLSPEQRHIAMNVGEMIQLANVTRDIEKDLLHGVAYHPNLKSFLRQEVPRPSKSSGPIWLDQQHGPSGDVLRAVHLARSAIFNLAMDQAPSYSKLVNTLPFRTWSLSRASAVLMLDFTDRYYNGCALRLGRPTWPGPKNPWTLVFGAFLPFFSRRAALKRVHRIEKSLLAARTSTCE